MTARAGVISHWYHAFENYSTSATEFYAQVERAVRRREPPSVHTSRVEHGEGGILGARREYLRISRDRLNFDICAAPFGKGFFFSWWLAERPGNPFAAALGCFGLIVAPAIVATILRSVFHAPFWLAMLAIPATWWALGTAIRAGAAGLEDAVLQMPVIGVVYQYIFKPTTYYRVDTTLMFQECVRAAVMEVIDELMNQQGLRTLSPEERAPKMPGDNYTSPSHCRA